MPQDYIQGNMPLDEWMNPLKASRSYCLDISSNMEISAVPPQVRGSTFAEDENQVDQDLVIGPEKFMDQCLNGLLIDTTESCCRAPQQVMVTSLHCHHCYLQCRIIKSKLTGIDAHVAESMRCHLNFDPNSAPVVARVYDSVQNSGPMVVQALQKS
jgi:suppressor of cytokine signaling 7